MTSIACGPQLAITFDPGPRSRRNDPESSHVAAREHQQSGAAATHAAIVIAVLRASGEPLTYREVHRRADIVEAVEVMRRLDDLRRQELVETGPQRICRVSGRLAQTWRVK
jgi:hypothetical protein